MKNGGGVVALVATILMGCAQSDRPMSSGPISFADFIKTDSVKTEATAQCGADCQKRRQELRYVVYVGDQIYCYWDMKKAETGVDFPKLARELEESITDKTSFTEYYQKLNRWAASFHDGHVNVIPAKPGLLEVFSAPLRTELLAPGTDHEQLVVIASSADGIRVGDVVTAINGTPTQQAIDAAETLKSGSTRRMRRGSAGRTMLDALGIEEGSRPLTLTVTNAKGTSVVPVLRNVQIVANTTAKDKEKEEDDLVQSVLDGVRILPGGVGYVKLKGFSGADKAEAMFEQIMDRLANTNGLVLDLRRNGGGDMSGNRFLSRFTNKEIVRYRQSERWSDFLISQRPDIFLQTHLPGAPFVEWHDVSVKPDSRRYDKPVVALIGSYCFSACDTFSAGLKSNKLATFVGEGTGGGTGTPLVFELPVSDLYFRYSVVRGQTVEGNLLEGVGTEPDIAVEPTVADRATSQDSQLKRALEVFGGGSVMVSELVPASKASLDEAPTHTEIKSLLNMRLNDEL